MDFFYWQSQRFGKSLKTFGLRIFFLEILKSIGWNGFSYGFLVVLNLFCLKLLLILNLTIAVISKTIFGSIFVSSDGALCTKRNP